MKMIQILLIDGESYQIVQLKLYLTSWLPILPHFYLSSSDIMETKLLNLNRIVNRLIFD